MYKIPLVAVRNRICKTENFMTSSNQIFPICSTLFLRDFCYSSTKKSQIFILNF